MKELSTLLQAKLKQKMAESGISANALEKKAGLKRSAVQNILHGRSKKPNIEILHAITRVLDCSVDDLLGQKSIAGVSHSIVIDSSSELTTSQFDYELYIKAVRLTQQIFTQKNLLLNQVDTINYIKEIYQYSLDSKNDDIDRRFAEWLADKFLSKQI